MVTRSPEAIFSTGCSAASRKPQCTASGLEARRCVRAHVDGCATEMFTGSLLASRMLLSRAGLERDAFSSNRHLALLHCWSMIPRVEPEGMLFRKPVSTFRDHALTARNDPRLHGE